MDICISFFIISIFISYNLISYYFILKKSKYVKKTYIDDDFLFKLATKTKFYSINKYLISKQEKLINSGNLYGLNLFKYIIIKYFLSTFLFFTLFYNSKNFFLSIIIFLIIFFLLDILIYVFEKNEGSKLVNEISNIVQNIILSLSANMSLYDALISSINIIKYERFKKEYIEFINKYRMHNYNMVLAVNEFEKKFNTYEFNMFLSILIECEKEGKYIELLENLEKSLEIRYFKYLEIQSIKNTFVIVFAIIIALLNSIAIIGYPMIIEIFTSVNEIFIW
mgnify:CR=1 FL=1